jgi:hypothetical protein
MAATPHWRQLGDRQPFSLLSHSCFLTGGEAKKVVCPRVCFGKNGQVGNLPHLAVVFRRDAAQAFPYFV